MIQTEDVIQLLYDMEDYLVSPPNELQDRFFRILAALESKELAQDTRPGLLQGEVLAAWARQEHLERYRAKENGTLLLGSVPHYGDDVPVIILEGKPQEEERNAEG